MLKSGNFVKFIPLDSIRRREAGTSNIKPFKDGMRFINIMIRIIMLFDPQKIFLPFGGGLIVLGILLAVYQLLTKDKVTGSVVLACLSGLFIVLAGLVAEQVSAIRRELSQFQRPSD